MNETFRRLSDFCELMKSSRYRQWGTALLVGGLAAFGAALYLNQVPPEFMAVARIRVQRLDPRTPAASLTDRESVSDPSDAMLSNVVENLGLEQRWGERYAGGTRLGITEALLRLRQHLELSPVRNSALGTPTALTEIRVTDEQPGEAAQIANAIAELIQREHLAKNDESVSTAAKTLETSWEQQWNEREQKIREVRSKLNALRLDLHISEYEDPPPDTDQKTLRSFNELKGELTRLQAELENFKKGFTKPEMADKVSMTLVEIADSAQSPRQPVWPSPLLKSVLLIFAAALSLSGVALMTIPQWLAAKPRKAR